MVQPEELTPDEKDQEAPEEGQGRGYTCKYCGQTFPSINLLGTHSKTCPERRKALEAEQKARVESTEPIYKTEGDANAILEGILEKHPDITARIREEIMDWARLKGFLQPMEVQQIIQSFRGVSSSTAQIIAAKYAFALQKAQSEGKLVIPYPPVVQPTQPIQAPVFPSIGPPVAPQPFPTLQTSQQPIGSQIQISPPTQPQPIFPWLQPPQQAQTYQQQPTDIRSIIRDELRYYEERMRPRETEAYVEIERPVRLPDGKIVLGPDDKPIVERMRVPVSQAHLFAAKETSDINILREELKELREELRNREIEMLRAEIEEVKKSREAPSQPQVPPEDLVDKAVKKVLEEKEKEKKEEERFARLERAIREASSAKAVEGYREDSYRILGQGLSEAASVIKERKPIEVIIREGGQLLLGSQPPPKEVEAGAEPESILERLKKRGWVTEQ